MSFNVQLTANGTSTTLSSGAVMYLPVGTTYTLTPSYSGSPSTYPQPTLVASLKVASTYAPHDAQLPTPLQIWPSATSYTGTVAPIPAIETLTVSGSVIQPLTIRIVAVADFVPVQEFGVLGNGTSDDSGAIQAAINALAGTGLALLFSAATYNVVATALTNASGVPLLFGPGATATGGNASSLTAQWMPLPGPATTSIALTTGTVNLTAAQAAAKTVILTGSLTGNVTVVFPTNSSQDWIVDATGCTLNAHTITAQANSNNWGTTIGVTNQYRVSYGQAVGKLYGVALTP